VNHQNKVSGFSCISPTAVRHLSCRRHMHLSTKSLWCACLTLESAFLLRACPHHLDAFLINSSRLPCHLNAFLTPRRQQQPCQEKRLYIFFSLHLFFILLLSTSSHLLAKHLQLASYQHPPPDLQPASHTTLPLFGIPHRDHEVELQHARHGCRRGSGQGHAQPAPLVSQPPHSSPLRTSC
jgi:hypothetical protein